MWRGSVKIRISVFLLAAILLVGCKVEIKVPEGGHVEGWALHGCGEAQNCVIDVDHNWFTEVFTAMPRDTHRFQGWKKQKGFFCGGSQQSCTLNTFGFASASLKALLADEEAVFYLEPLFISKSADYQNRISPDLHVTVHISQENYPVNASSHSSWFDGIQSSFNPLEQREDGSKATGYSSWRSDKSSYSYRFEAGRCHITKYEKAYYQHTTMPSPYAPEELSVEAIEVYWDILLHEGGHHRIYRWMFDRRVQQIYKLFEKRSITGVNSLETCNDYLYIELARIQDETYEQHLLEGQEFHGYDTGWTWGVCDDIPNKFMNIYCPSGMK